ncbi:MAG: hypothetical protein M1820_005689 [Bogoriella megaspora]|nr:MAG: hypothetical protein M1820_005689 [Bogoriella megaspora]
MELSRAYRDLHLPILLDSTLHSTKDRPRRDLSPASLAYCISPPSESSRGSLAPQPPADPSLHGADEWGHPDREKSHDLTQHQEEVDWVSHDPGAYLEGEDHPSSDCSESDPPDSSAGSVLREEASTDSRQKEEGLVQDSLHIPSFEGLSCFVDSAEARFHASITISDDQSSLEKVEARNLLALRDRNHIRNKFPDQVAAPSENHALQDYQMQLMLLEQQSKAKSLLARQEQEQEQEQSNLMVAKMTTQNNISNFPTIYNGTHLDSKRKIDDIELLALLQSDTSNMDDIEVRDLLGSLQASFKRSRGMQEFDKRPPFKYQILYRILEDCMEPSRNGHNKYEKRLSVPFFDPPEQVYGQGRTQTLRGKVPLENFDLFLEQNKDLSFIVYRTYISSLPELPNSRTLGASPEVEESIQPIRRELIDALMTILASRPEFADVLQKMQTTSELYAPYLFMYYLRGDLEAFRTGLQQSAKDQLALFSDYVLQSHGPKYYTADSLISQGKITTAYIDYLFKPGDVLVARNEDIYRGWVASSWARRTNTERMLRSVAEASKKGAFVPLYGSRDAFQRTANDVVLVHHFNVDAWCWSFDGNFQRTNDVLRFTIQTEDKQARFSKGSEARSSTEPPREDGEDGISIQELRVFPLRFASPSITETLRRRGKTFWSCRQQRFVSYCEQEKYGTQSATDERYMIDFKTYRRLHGNSLLDRSSWRTELKDELGPDAMARDDPPDDQFELLLPPKIKGYNLRRKKWYDLLADNISDVKWNKEAFSKVVIDRRARDLIRALVSKQLAGEVSTDLIEGKGNGLILLFHGSPGTGKTLTAESVAEIAEKPLYRVTCGDVGTQAEDVEKYLESVFHLGKLWDCVVLLDEADVFLEQRSLEDLQRNALVSVFLRMLEYYEGILVLTSNRVGIFDEAFKSRIQLALHYPALGQYQRLRVWENFLDRLESFNDDLIDIADLRDKLEELAKEKMNGRQIRNALTTARQYAEWKHTTLTYEHLKDVIEVSGRFDKYLDKLNGGLTQDELAEDEGRRLA